MNIALVLGSAACVDDDIAHIESFFGGPFPGTVVAVNDMIWKWEGHLDHAVTLHAENFEKKRWDLLRRERGGNTDYLKWTARGHEDRGPVDRVVGEEYSPDLSLGTSGWLGVLVARIVEPAAVLAGIPMDQSGYVDRHTADTPLDEVERDRIDGYRDVWAEGSRKLMGTVKSPSGWTRELFGEPTGPWLEEML